MKNNELKSGCVEICPACPHRSLSKDESLVEKQNWLLKALSGFTEKLEFIRSVNENKRWNYRKKVCLAAEYSGEKWLIGVRKRKTVIPIHNCPVQYGQINKNIQLFSRILPDDKQFPLAYFIQSGGQLTLVLKCRELPGLQSLSDQVKEELHDNGVEGLWLHANPATGKKVIGKNGWHLVFGKPRSFTASGFIYGPSSFQQVLPELYEDSLEVATNFLKPEIGDLVIDLYCGIGSSLRKWTESGAEVIGVELSGEALECAAINAPGAKLLRGTCTQRIPQLNVFAQNSSASGKEIVMYANPPRTGLEKEVAIWIAKELRPTRLAYLSCSAGTLYRDLKLLAKYGFRAKKIIPYDFFPQTRHTEILALFSTL